MPTLAPKPNAGKPANKTGAIRTAAQADLLIKISAAVAAADEAETTVTAAQAELVSRSKAVGLLLLEAKKLHPAVKDFEAFLGMVQGLKLSRAYDCMRIAGGRTTDEEIKKATRDRVEKHRAAKKRLELVPTPDLSVTRPDTSPEMPVNAALPMGHVTETAESSIDPQYAAEEKESARCLAEFQVACRIWLPRVTVQADQWKARELVAELTFGQADVEAA